MEPTKDDGTPFEFIIDLIYNTITDESSKYYLPKIVAEQKKPCYEPYEVDKFGVDLNKADATVCVNGCDDCIYIPNPIGLPDVTMTNSEFAGFSNCSAPVKPTIISQDHNSGVVELNLVFSSLKSEPYPLKVTVAGNFDYSQKCCKTDKQQKCTGEDFEAKGDGTFLLQVLESSSSVKATITTNGTNVDIAISSLTYVAPVFSDPQKQHRNMKVLKITGDKGYVNQSFKHDLNLPETLTQIITNLNKQMNHPPSLKILSTQITNVVNNLLNN